jgi:hypothetical protein
VSNPTADDLKRKVNDIRSGKSGADLHRINGHWYVDSSGKIGKFKTLDKIDSERKYAMIRRGKPRDYTSTNMENVSAITDKLTNAQCGYLLRLQCNIEYETGMIVHKNKSNMSTSDMISILGLSRKRQTFYDFFSACIDNGIVSEFDVGYRINPRYHFKGESNVPYYIKSYTAKVEQVYREVKAADIGLIYRMLQYVHYDTNALCSNPFEKDPTKVSKFNRKQLADALGISPTHVSNRLPKMKFGNEYVVAKVTFAGDVFYMINPYVFYRKKGEADKFDNTLKMMFTVSGN